MREGIVRKIRALEQEKIASLTHCFDLTEARLGPPEENPDTFLARLVGLHLAFSRER